MSPEEKLARIHELSEWGDHGTDWERHGEDCPSSYDEADAFKHYTHSEGCAKEGQRVHLIRVDGTAWPIVPELECCDPDNSLDEAEMLEACECGLKDISEIRKLSAPGTPQEESE